MLRRALGLLLAVTALAAAASSEPSLLDDGDPAFIRPPLVRFAAEVARLGIAAPVFAGTPTNAPTRSSAEAELDDLRLALEERGVAPERAEEVMAAHRTARRTLEEFTSARETWRPGDDPAGEEPALVLEPSPPELPAEFRRYFAGMVAWRRGESRAARAAWEGVLHLPAPERRQKSVWAAYMLGRAWEEEDPARARREYAGVRRLAAEGFRDSDALAVASLGREARLHLAAEEWGPAFRLYLQQHAAGDYGALASLKITAARLFAASAETWGPVVEDRLLSRLATAWLAAQDDAVEAPDAAHAERVRQWAEVLGPPETADPAVAELVALALFQIGEVNLAEPWLVRAGATPVTSWLRAKAELARGHHGRAAAWWSDALRRVPDPAAPEGLIASLYVGSSWPETPTRAVCRLRGERGALRLARGDFTGALDDFLRSGHWTDAAYVAERVLTVEELKDVTDGAWREPAPLKDRPAPAEPDEQREIRGRLRDLLARRLVRMERGDEAAAYFNAELRPVHQLLQRYLLAGQDESLPPETRARAWYGGAHLVRTRGIELLATELAPDWAQLDGWGERDLTADFRATNAHFRLVRPCDAELTRARSHAPEPDRRFHYRYRAAGLAWAAAELLPDGEAAAGLLDAGGRWLMHRDPDAADFFYKRLVRRGRATALGEAADLQRWFPPLDAAGRPFITRHPPPGPATEAAPVSPQAVADESEFLDGTGSVPAATEAASGDGLTGGALPE